MAIQLRSYVFLDSLQPQHAAFLGTVARGFLPLPGDASLWIEISPGIEINRITDIAVKAVGEDALAERDGDLVGVERAYMGCWKSIPAVKRTCGQQEQPSWQRWV